MASNSVLQGWNTLTKKLPRRGASFNPYRPYKAIARPPPRPQTRQQYKQARISTESAESTTSTGGTQTHLPMPSRSTIKLTLDDFKKLNVDEKLDKIFLRLQDTSGVNERLTATENQVRELRDQTNTNNVRLNLLAYKSVDAEAGQRQNNLIGWGIPEAINEDCMEVIKDFLIDKFSLDPEEICIQRAHRIGLLHTGRSRQNKVRHRALIVAFRDYQDCELILTNASNRKGSDKGVSRNYPQEIINARKPLSTEMKALKANYPSSKISIQYPAKLVIDGRIHMDMFPEWREYMRRDRLKTGTLDDESSDHDEDNCLDLTGVFMDTGSHHAASVNEATEEVVASSLMSTQFNISDGPTPNGSSAHTLFGSIRPTQTKSKDSRSQIGSPNASESDMKPVVTPANEATDRPTEQQDTEIK